MFKRLRFLSIRLQQEGIKELARAILHRLVNGTMPPPLTVEISEGIDLLGAYDFILPKILERKSTASIGLDSSAKTINWVIPSFGIGSGGHINIFRFVGGLEKNGYICHVSIVGDSDFESAEEARKCIIEHFEPLKATVSLGIEGDKSYWLTFATSWITAYLVRDIVATKNKAYFVQDFEPEFYAKGSEYFFAEDTYRFGFNAITAGSWLSEKLAKEYGMNCRSVGFSYDKQRYQNKRDSSARVKRVFFYCRPPTPRRAFELGVLVLNEVYRKNPDVEFVFAGWDVSNYDLPFPYLNAGLVSLDELPDLYCKVDAALVISSTNLSLLPLELMACGCPVISNSGANVEWLLKDGANAALANPTVADLSSAIDRILNDEGYRSRLTEQALDYCSATSWDNEIKQFVGAIEEFYES
jgi:glycosyltransferase involved in cell wall biosynthesis